MPVTRRVSRIEPAPGTALYVLALLDRSAEFEAGRSADVVKAELQATLESVSDGVLVTDLAGHISNFNRRFAALWELPDEMLLLRADDEVFDWMRLQVAEPRDYMIRLAEIDAETHARGDRPVRAALGPADRAHDRTAVQPRACRSAGSSASGNGRICLHGHRVLLAAAGRGAS